MRGSVEMLALHYHNLPTRNEQMLPLYFFQLYVYTYWRHSCISLFRAPSAPASTYCLAAA